MRILHRKSTKRMYHLYKYRRTNIRTRSLCVITPRTICIQCSTSNDRVHNTRRQCQQNSNHRDQNTKSAPLSSPLFHLFPYEKTDTSSWYKYTLILRWYHDGEPQRLWHSQQDTRCNKNSQQSISITSKYARHNNITLQRFRKCFTD